MGDGREYELPRLPRPARVHVWQVPEGYRANGLFVSVATYGQPKEIPACAPADTAFLGVLDLEPCESAALEAAKQDKVQALYVVRRARIYQDAAPYTFPGDTEPDGVQMRDEMDRQNLQDLFIEAQIHIVNGEPDKEMFFMAKSNEQKTFTALQCVEMCRTLLQQGKVVYQQSWAIKDQIKAAATQEDLDAIDIENW